MTQFMVVGGEELVPTAVELGLKKSPVLRSS
jgi:hypothetical protein